MLIDFFNLNNYIFVIMEKDYSKLLAIEFKTRVIDESFNRIRVCLSLINENDLNRSPNSHITPISNQIEHICGNIRQWMLGSLGQEEDMRDRDSEFETKPARKDELLDLLSVLESDLGRIIDHLSDEQLQKVYNIQGFEVNGLSALVHVIEHCSYHTGQVTLLTKLYSEKETGYYAGKDLNVKNT